MTINIFENAKSGSFLCNNFKDKRPDVAVIRLAFAPPSEGEGLAGISCCDDVAVRNKFCWIIG